MEDGRGATGADARLADLHQRFAAAADAVSDRVGFEALRVEWVGRKQGIVRDLLAGLKTVAPEERAAYGQAVNALKVEVEAKVFNAAVGDLLGPFAAADGSFYEIFHVTAKHPAKLDEDTAAEVRRLLREGWLAARAQEHLIEAR